VHVYVCACVCVCVRVYVSVCVYIYLHYMNLHNGSMRTKLLVKFLKKHELPT